jgi:hypothetical protein
MYNFDQRIIVFRLETDPAPAKNRPLQTRPEPKPVTQEAPAEEIEFKEVQIKAVDINISQLRSGKPVIVRTQV